MCGAIGGGGGRLQFSHHFPLQNICNLSSQNNKSIAEILQRKLNHSIPFPVHLYVDKITE